MAKIKRYTEADGGYHGELGFYCPGCKCRHWINDAETKIESEEHYKALGFSRPDIWSFNNDFENPTIRASVLVVVRGKNPNSEAWDIEKIRCHSFVTDGKIQFLSDCTHELKGQTIELPQILENGQEN